MLKKYFCIFKPFFTAAGRNGQWTILYSSYLGLFQNYIKIRASQIETKYIRKVREFQLSLLV